MGNTPGRQLSLNRQNIFIPGHSWIPVTRTGRKALFNSYKNVFTFVESKELRSTWEEPRSMREYFLSSEGISENVIQEYVTSYCGNVAEVATVLFKLCCKDFPRNREANVP